MLTCKVSAVVRLQAVACGLLARRLLQEMRQPMHKATLATVDLSSAERDLAPWDGHQQPRQPTAVFKREHGVFPRAATSNSAAAAVRESLPSLSPAGTHCLAPPHSATGRREEVSAGRYRD
jgi:hypothetical protein